MKPHRPEPGKFLELTDTSYIECIFAAGFAEGAVSAVLFHERDEPWCLHITVQTWVRDPDRPAHACAIEFVPDLPAPKAARVAAGAFKRFTQQMATALGKRVSMDTVLVQGGYDRLAECMAAHPNFSTKMPPGSAEA